MATNAAPNRSHFRAGDSFPTQMFLLSQNRSIWRLVFRVSTLPLVRSRAWSATPPPAPPPDPPPSSLGSICRRGNADPARENSDTSALFWRQMSACWWDPTSEPSGAAASLRSKRGGRFQTRTHARTYIDPVGSKGIHLEFPPLFGNISAHVRVALNIRRVWLKVPGVYF